VLRAKSKETIEHSKRVADYSLKISKALNLSNKESEEIYKAALLHDIGKIAFSKEILQFSPKFSSDDYTSIRLHPFIGENIIKSLSKKKIPISQEVLKAILYHHERYDGKGYPKGLKGKQIPIASRIIAIADSYDAAFHSYSKKGNKKDDKKSNKKKAIKELVSNKGKQFDPQIVNKFLILLKVKVK